MKINHHILPEFGAVPYENLTSSAVHDFITRKINSGLSAKTDASELREQLMHIAASFCKIAENLSDLSDSGEDDSDDINNEVC